MNGCKTDEIVFSLYRCDVIVNNAVNNSVNLLRINLDGKLNWRAQTHALCLRLSRVIFYMSKLRLCTSFDVLIPFEPSSGSSTLTYLMAPCSGAILLLKRVLGANRKQSAVLWVLKTSVRL